MMVPDRGRELLASPLAIFRSVERSKLLPMVTLGRVKFPLFLAVSVAFTPINSGVRMSWMPRVGPPSF